MLWVLVALFVMPSLANAVTARHEPEEPGCLGKGKEAKVEAAQGKVAEGKVRAAEKMVKKVEKKLKKQR